MSVSDVCETDAKEYERGTSLLIVQRHNVFIVAHYPSSQSSTYARTYASCVFANIKRMCYHKNKTIIFETAVVC